MFPYQFVAVAVWPTVKKHRVTRTTLADGQREFADQLHIDQASSLPMIVQGFGFVDTQTVLYYERITAICPPLLVERGDTPLPTCGNDIANPLRVYRATLWTTFAARY